MIRTALVTATLFASITAHADPYFVTVDEVQAMQKAGDVRFVWSDTEKLFEKEHIPSSVEAYAHDLHILDDVKACKGLPMCETRAADFIGKALGIDAATPVVVYDGGVGANASGTWFFLALYGHKNVKILEGGLAAWKAKGLPVESGKPKAQMAKAFKPAVDWSMIATRDEVVKATGDQKNYFIVDARHNLDEYTGKELQSALTAPGKEVTVARGGAIPTAVFSPWKKYAGNPSGDANKTTLKDADDIQKQLTKLQKNGYGAEKTVISYCHVGLGRGSFQYLALKKAGHNNVKVYIGSWNEWGNDASLPLAQQ
jgi:thiosulfate/3-mercaptopyruvate sulfurtransferase